jgi:hypothetical protein
MTPLKLLLTAKPRLLAISLCLLMSTLCACSTQPVRESLLVPPQAAMQKSQPLPLLPEDHPITVKEFTDSDLEVVKDYHTLATYHDALVDWVQQLLDQQANGQ